MPDAPCTPETVVRRGYRVTGQVQGVGFRPFIYRLAMEMGLSGTVRNDPTGVTIDVWRDGSGGDAEAELERFAARITTDAPALACVDGVRPIELDEPRDPEPGFRIIHSDHEPARRGRVTVDSATCPDCLREMLDPDDRRSRHPLINCTNCGPRYTIVRDLPYDRPLTTMADFPMCPTCQAEYDDPADRRFHAQPTCCPSCGPKLTLTDVDGNVIDGDPIEQAAELLRGGGVLAVKGLGGYHLAVDACSEEAVSRLRGRKKRDHKPLAVMVPDLETARRLAVIGDGAAALMTSPVSPIVLLDRHDDTTNTDGASGPEPMRLASGVAPGLDRLGLMLPYTPIQHLLFSAGLGPLVMTSANITDEPLVKDDDEARRRLTGIADQFLLHDRPIERSVDDSVVLGVRRPLLPIRRARGYVPGPLFLPIDVPAPGLCVGAELKNTVAIARDREAILSHHLGDLTHVMAYRWFERTIDDFQRLFDVEPTWVACDMHPAYLSRRYALKFARSRGVEVLEIQHHHAHVAALLAEHGVIEPTIGLVCDGVGYGADGGVWGGEIFVATLADFERVGSFRPLRLPGGDAAAKETGRCAVSWLVDALGPGCLESDPARRIMPDDRRRRMIGRMLDADMNCPPSTGTGRLFDAAAALLGLCDYNHHEAMSGMALEAAASRSGARPPGADMIEMQRGEPFALDHRPLARALVEGLERGESTDDLAFLFHDAIADALARAARRVADATGIETVGLTGGVFCNALLTDLVIRRLTPAGMRVLTHEQVPPNDGGIALGQAAIAAARLRKEHD
jgi:hydrogenase maturation protein HypF